MIDNLERRATADRWRRATRWCSSATRAAILANPFTRAISSSSAAQAPKVDLALEKKNGDFVRGLIHDGLVRARTTSPTAASPRDGEMALGSDVGVALGYQGDLTDAQFLYGEDQARYLDRAAQPTIGQARRPRAQRRRQYLVVGEAGGREISFLGASGVREGVNLGELRHAHESWLPTYMKKAG
jgi:phosphoribosylformylglycinamidine (FGAM) synthase-like enzyme